jgi:hypothetical protein
LVHQDKDTGILGSTYDLLADLGLAGLEIVERDSGDHSADSVGVVGVAGHGVPKVFGRGSGSAVGCIYAPAVRSAHTTTWSGCPSLR